MNTLLQLIGDHALTVAFFNVLLVQLGLPFPAYPVLIVTGALAAHGQHSTASLLGAAVAACLVADLAWYAAGRSYGGRVVRSVCRISLSPDSCVRQTESLFTRWGAWSLLVAKFIPGFGTIAAVLAGNTRLPLARFIAFDAAGSALYAGVAIGLGMLFRDAVDDTLAVFEEMGHIGLALVVLALVAFVAVKWWQRHSLLRELRMSRISVPELQVLLDADPALAIVDVRSAESRQRDGAIPGAIHWPRDAGPEAGAEMARDVEVVVYCACPNEVSAAQVARKLRSAGFRSVRPLHGGIDAWIGAGLPIEYPQAIAAP